MTKLAIIICIGLTMAGCAQSAARRERPADLAASNVYYDTQVSMGRCNQQAHVAPLLAAIATSIVTQGVNRIGNALRAAASESKANVLARRNIELAAGGMGECVVVMRGWFFRDPERQLGQMRPVRPGELDVFSPEQLSPLHEMGLYPAAAPEFYFEGALVPNSNGSSYLIVPVRAGISRPLISNSLRSDGRHVAINFAFVKGGADEISGGGGSTVTLGELRPGEIARFGPDFCQIAVRQASGNPPTERVTDTTGAGLDDCPTPRNLAAGALRIIHSPAGSEWFSIDLSPTLQTMTLLANVTEVNNASAFLTFLADIFKDNQQAIATDLSDRILPATNTQLAQRDTARTTYDRELVEVEAAVRACVGEPGDPAKRLAARVAVREFLAAARSAEMPEIAGIADVIPLRSDASAQCQQVLAALPPG
jgi:hypothetical protein